MVRVIAVLEPEQQRKQKKGYNPNHGKKITATVYKYYVFYGRVTKTIYIRMEFKLSMDKVTRTGISFEPKLLELFDKFIKEKDYSKNVSNLQHDYHCQILSSMHTYLDHHTCLELIVVKGEAERVKKLLEKIKNTKGVKKAELVLEK